MVLIQTSEVNLVKKMATPVESWEELEKMAWEEFERPNDVKLKDFIKPLTFIDSEKKTITKEISSICPRFFQILATGGTRKTREKERRETKTT